ncbi:hypothetical protein A5656_12115 [Mycobacterium gordonae]|nr:hypothetical protein [Mycobacterium gordonae]OBK61226.1 hypothetical protein A5656_12115 [Mycobacterium gordonae]
MAASRKANTTARGLGWAHQQQVAALLRALVDGTLCWWCALPMFRNKLRNWDQRTLAGDHEVPRTRGGHKANRLLHATCNEQRGDGTRDHLRPALTGTHPSEWQGQAGQTAADDLDPRLLPWP